MRLILIRHGDPDYVNDTLTERGRIEAKLLADWLATKRIDKIYVSPKGRAQATASYTLEKTGMTAETLPWLREFWAKSRIWEDPELEAAMPYESERQKTAGRPIWDILPAYLDDKPDYFHPEDWRNTEVCAHGNMVEIYHEVTTEFDKLLAAHGYVRAGRNYRVERGNSDTLVFFCHLGLACVLMSHLINCSPIVLWQGTCLPPASVTTVYTEERRPGLASFRIQALGDTSHLYVGGAEPSFAGRFCEIYGNGDRTD